MRAPRELSGYRRAPASELMDQFARLDGLAPEASELARHGGPGSGNSLARPGSRLQPQLDHIPGGIVSTAGQLDTRFDMSCDFRADVTGTLRCMSTDLYEAQFLDPACSTQPVIAAWNDPTAGAHVTVYHLDSNGNETAAVPFRVGGNVRSRTYYQLDGGVCQEITEEVEEDFAALDPVPLRTLVAGRERLVRIGGSRIYATVVAGSDGSRTGATGYFDVRLGTHVKPVVTTSRGLNDQAVTWLPADPDPDPTGFFDSAFADPGCTTQAVAFLYGNTTPHRLAAIPWTPQLNRSCSAYNIPLRALDQTPVIDAYVGTPASCQLVEGNTLPVYTVGDTVSTRRYVTGELRLRGRGRLAARDIVSDDGSVAWESIHYVPFFDRVLGANCRVRSQDDGSWICNPYVDYSAPPAEVDAYLGYVDEGCTQPALIATQIADEACFDGEVRGHTFAYEDPTHSTVYRGSRRLSATPIPVYLGYDEDGVMRCFPNNEHFAYAIDSAQTIDLAKE